MLARYAPLPQPRFFTSWDLLSSSEVATNEFGESMKNCTNGVKWILNVFGDCVDTNLKIAGFIIGIISLLLWLVPVIPQIYQNYRTKRCEGLSFAFILFWLTGDLCNMIGSLLTHQQPLQQIIAVYYIFQDVILVSQYVYYTRLYGANRNVLVSSTIVVPMLFTGLIVPSLLGSYTATPDTIDMGVHVGRRLLSSRSAPVGGVPIFDSYSDAVGYAIGSVAAVCYFAGRIPQLMRNYYRKSCEGLSLTMFYIIVVANLTYGSSVILESTDWKYIWRHMPWLVGSLGCCFFDFIVILQYYHYKRRQAEGVWAEEQEGLLYDDDEEPATQ